MNHFNYDRNSTNNLNNPSTMDHKHNPQYPYHMPQQPYMYPQHPGHYPAPHPHHAHPGHYPQGPAHPQTPDGRGFQRNPGLVIPPGTLHHKPSITMVGGPQYMHPEHHTAQEPMHPSMYPAPQPYDAGGGYPHHPGQYPGAFPGAPHPAEAGVIPNPGLVIPKGTLHSRVVGPFTYRTYDGRAFFKFNYVEKEDGRWDMDIVEQPGYGGRDTNQNIIHRWPSARGAYASASMNTSRPKTCRQRKP